MHAQRAPLSFDEWAESIAVRVAAAIPGVRIKRKFDELYRWVHGGKECQVHAVSESRAAFVALSATQGGFPVCGVCDHMNIAQTAPVIVAARIVRWLTP